MIYYVIMCNDFPEYIVPEDAIPPAECVSRGVDTAEKYAKELVRTIQREYDKQDGATTAWKRRRVVHVTECKGYNYMKEVPSEPEVKYINHVDVEK